MDRFLAIGWRTAVSLWLVGAFIYNLYSEGFKFPFSVLFFAFVYVVLMAIWLKELKLKISTRSLSLVGISLFIAIFGSATALAVAGTYPLNCDKSYGKAHAACALENFAYSIGGYFGAVGLFALPTAICVGLFILIMAKRPLKP